MMPNLASRNDLFARFEELGIKTTTKEHEAAFTVDQARELRGALPGGHCKCLFLKAKKGGALYLAVVDENRRVDLKALAKRFGAGRFSFGKPELLMEVLGITPGSVTPFALINDQEQHVNVILDAEMMTFELLNYHPLENTATTAISPGDLALFIKACGHTPLELDFEALSSQNSDDA